MSSDEADKKNVDESTLDTASSAEENEEKEEVKEEKVNSKPASKKKGADPPKIKQPAKKRVKTEQAEKESKKEDKKEEKKKPQPVDDDEDEDEESAEENDVENHKDKAVPLLDQPLELTGSRKRKEVERFKPVEPQEENKEVKIPKGKGKALGDIPRVEFNLQRGKPEDLKILHRFCFGGMGKAATIKKFLRKFNGFEFEEASDDYEKKKTVIEKSFKKVTMAHLKNVCIILDLEKGGTKDDILDRILSFLVSPVDSGKKLPGTGRSKRKGASSKNYDEGEERFDAKKKSGKGKKKGEDSGESEDDEKEESEEEEQEEEVKTNSNSKKKEKEKEKEKEEAPTTEESAPEEEEEEKEKEVEKPKKGGKKAAKKTTEVTEKKAPPKKRAAAKKAAEKKSESEGEADGDIESEEDEPLVKKAKAPPTLIS